MTILNHFEKIINLFGEDGLSVSFFDTAKDHLEAVSLFLKISYVQAALFAIILENDPVETVKFAGILKCKRIQMIKYLEDLDFLKNRKLINIANRSRYTNEEVYTVSADVLKAIRKNIEYQIKTNQNLSPEEFYDSIDNILEACEADEIDRSEREDEINTLMKENKNICFVKMSKDYCLDDLSILVMLVFSCNLLHRDEDELRISYAMRDILTNLENRRLLKSIKNKEHELIISELIEPSCNNGIGDTEYFKLTQKARDEFLADVDVKKVTKHKGKNIILSQEISEKELYYNEKIKDRISELTRLLHNDNFSNIQKRLTENGMRTGFACIFSGPPGTGKTETVYQIARQTGRDILLVDISETKSMWFGESEKQIKAVFDRYRKMVNTENLAPILLFNEADAVFSKRQELPKSRSGPGQTENAIQNIILQEMENLNGILIATTNMTMNLDKAFERRFLYKIEFDKPDTDSKKLMWQKFIPSLCENDAFHLAKKFDFSGGQIENIMRKSTVSFILNGESPDFIILENFCKE